MSDNFPSFLLTFPAFSMVEPPWKVMARLQIETMALVSRRSQAYMELPAMLAQCHNPQDLLTEQVRFWQMAQRQYAHGLEKIVGSVPLTQSAEGSAEETPTQPKARDYMIVSDRDAAAGLSTGPSTRDGAGKDARPTAAATVQPAAPVQKVRRSA